MSIKKYICLIAVGLSLLSLPLHAQYYNYSPPMPNLEKSSEIRLHIGANTFWGDLGGRNNNGWEFIKDFDIKTVKPFVGISYGYYVKDWLNINAGINYTRVDGADSLIKSKEGKAYRRYLRNLSFKSDITEINATVEIYPFQLLERFKSGRLRPFIGGGVGLFHFNPKAQLSANQLNGAWIPLHPLHLEGQGFTEYPDHKEYQLTQLYIPATAGIRYRLSDHWLASLNAIFRKTFTDYIDDVSTTYINPDLFEKYLPADKVAIARQLSYRKISQTNLSYVGKGRGGPAKDTYTTVLLTFNYAFNWHHY